MSLLAVLLSVRSLAILLVADVLHPVDHLAVDRLLDGDVRHGRRGRRPVPVLLARWEPDDVTGADLLDRPSLSLGPAAARRDDERLAERVRVPRRPCPRLDRDTPRTGSRRCVGLE